MSQISNGNGLAFLITDAHRKDWKRGRRLIRSARRRLVVIRLAIRFALWATCHRDKHLNAFGDTINEWALLALNRNRERIAEGDHLVQSGWTHGEPIYMEGKS